MVKIQGPLHSDSASGTIGPRITFSMRKTGAQARYQKAQKVEVPSWKQADNQSMYRVIYARWLSFSDAQRKVYDDEVKAKKLKISGWNLFLSYAFSNPLSYLGLSAYWSFNRTGFGTALDLSKNSFTGTLKPTWPSDSPFYLASKNKKMLNALSFDGTNDYVSVPGTPFLSLLRTARWSIDCWFKFPVFQLNSEWTFYGEGSTISITPLCVFDVLNSSILTGSQHKLHLFARITSAILIRCIGPTILQPGVWYHAAATFNGVIISIYLNGKLEDFKNIYGTYITNTKNIGCLQRPTFIQFMKGQLDEIRIYNRTLTLGEIKNLYNLFNA